MTYIDKYTNLFPCHNFCLMSIIILLVIVLVPTFSNNLYLNDDNYLVWKDDFFSLPIRYKGNVYNIIVFEPHIIIGTNILSAIVL